MSFDGDHCPLCKADGAACGGPTSSAIHPVDTPSAIVTPGGNMAELVAVQFGPRDMRQLSREDAEAAVKAGLGVIVETKHTPGPSALEAALAPDRIIPTRRSARAITPMPSTDAAATVTITPADTGTDLGQGSHTVASTSPVLTGATVVESPADMGTDLGQGSHTTDGAPLPADNTDDDSGESEGKNDDDASDTTTDSNEAPSDAQEQSEASDGDSGTDSKAVDDAPADKAVQAPQPGSAGRIEPRRRGSN